MTWSSKKQPVVALSSCESEYIALVYASQEAIYLSDLLSELTFPQFSSVQMYEDNMGALQLSGTTAFSSRTKDIFSYSTRSSTFASSLVLRGVCLLFHCFLYALSVQPLVFFQTSCSYTRISSLPYSRFLPDTLGHEFPEVYVLNNWSS